MCIENVDKLQNIFLFIFALSMIILLALHILELFSYLQLL